jgi:hypothetical protein
MPLVLILAVASTGLAETAPVKKAQEQLEAIRVPKVFVMLYRARAEGYQVYQCKPAPGKPDELAWVLTGPQADLFDHHGNKMGTHYGTPKGPAWELSDGSKARAVPKKIAPSPDASAVPWLLLEITEHEGTGRLGGARYIQRVDTWAGKAPAGKCKAGDAGKEKKVKYQATYLFFGPEP